jgi:hypothetical protein
MAAPRTRSPNGINLHRFLDEFGVKVRPYHEGNRARPANVVFGGRTVSRLMRKDIERTRTVIACIQASNPKCFDDVVIWSIWNFITAHYAYARRQDVVSLFRGIDIAEIHKRAARLASGDCARMGKTSEKIATLLADRLIEKEDAA